MDRQIIPKIIIFAGYQFKSNLYNRAELDSAITKSCEIAESDLLKANSISIEYHPVDVETGNILLHELSDSIKASDICIFEVSEINENVFFELGIAHALNKPIILLLSASSEKNPSLPSDLQGVFYLKYKNMAGLQSTLSKEIFRKVEKFLKSGKTVSAFLEHVWMKNSPHETVIIGEDIVSATKDSRKKDVYRAHSGDALAIIEAQINYAFVNDEMNILKISSKEVKGKDLQQDLIIIGGPSSNLITRRVLKEVKLPWKFLFGDEHPTGEKCLIRSDSEEQCTAVKNHEVSTDYCMVFVGPNPFNRSANVSIFAGLHTFGVVGGLRALSPAHSRFQVSNNVSEIIKKNWQPGMIFQVVSPVAVVNLDPVAPSFRSEQIEVLEFEKN